MARVNPNSERGKYLAAKKQELQIQLHQEQIENDEKTKQLNEFILYVVAPLLVFSLICIMVLTSNK